jgi:hypothetical protein
MEELREAAEHSSPSGPSGNEISDIFGDGNSAAAGSTLPPMRKTPAVGVGLPAPRERDPSKKGLNGLSGAILLLPALLYYLTDR